MKQPLLFLCLPFVLIAMDRPSEGWQNGQVVPSTCLVEGTKKAISPDTKYTITRHPQNKAQITLEGREKNNTRKKIFKHPDEQKASVYSVCWNPDSKQFATIIKKYRGQIDCQCKRKPIFMLYFWSINDNEHPLLIKDITGSAGNEYKKYTCWNSWDQFLCIYSATNVLLDLRLEAEALS